VIDPKELKRWIEQRRKRLMNDEETAGKKKIDLPNGIQIHIHMPNPQKLPLSRDGKTLMTQDNVAQYPS
jgi:hypothetical protein